MESSLFLQIPGELWEKELHIVAFKPLIANREVLHHMLLFGCTDGTLKSVRVTIVYAEICLTEHCVFFCEQN